ncbi:serine/threonine-protein phosphatase Pgam5, mitochondrial isoform X1 [Hetaerina americana]|uniref:serine/threonine-protein phosphatase Pgam5, mitochondrial isoform X1 n=1 Tax=Hetaerina americana TaxID=62018 RepID=UPI003A7F2CC3
MPSFSRLRSVFTGIGACGGALIFYYAFRENTRKRVHASWTTNYNPSVKWDFNWDKREPRSLIKPNEKDENKYNEQIEKAQPTAVRNLFLIRHGQYNLCGGNDQEKCLTELGRKQADLTGQRLKDLNFPFTKLVRSTMFRALETAEIIQKHLPDVPCESSAFIQEGAPIPPEPPVGHWRPEKHQFYEDGARIEAAFRKYFHRAPVSQEKDSFEIYVCHANVIRYFVCRALQFPPEGWLRLSLNNASITWISIRPKGNVVLHMLGDSGHLPPELVTTS